MDMMSSNQVPALRWANVRGGMLSKYLQWHNMAGILGIHFNTTKSKCLIISYLQFLLTTN